MSKQQRLLIRRHPHIVLGQETANDLLHVAIEQLAIPGGVVEVDVLGRPVAEIDTIAGHRALEPHLRLCMVPPFSSVQLLRCVGLK